MWMFRSMSKWQCIQQNVQFSSYLSTRGEFETKIAVAQFNSVFFRGGQLSLILSKKWVFFSRTAELMSVIVFCFVYLLSFFTKVWRHQVSTLSAKCGLFSAPSVQHRVQPKQGTGSLTQNKLALLIVYYLFVPKCQCHWRCVTI